MRRHVKLVLHSFFVSLRSLVWTRIFRNTQLRLRLRPTIRQADCPDRMAMPRNPSQEPASSFMQSALHRAVVPFCVQGFERNWAEDFSRRCLDAAKLCGMLGAEPPPATKDYMSRRKAGGGFTGARATACDGGLLGSRTDSRVGRLRTSRLSHEGI